MRAPCVDLKRLDALDLATKRHCVITIGHGSGKNHCSIGRNSSRRNARCQKISAPVVRKGNIAPLAADDQLSPLTNLEVQDWPRVTRLRVAHR